MSERVRVALTGATGLVGREIVRAAEAEQEVALTAIARREPDWLADADIQTFICDPVGWVDALAEARPEVLICALSTTWRKAGRDERAFRAVDYELVVSSAAAAERVGAVRAVVVSAVEASPISRSFYLRVKGEMERDLAALDWQRLDILRPGLLRGEREADRRLLEGVAAALSPLTDRVLHGGLRRYRSVSASVVARAALHFAKAGEGGVRVHQHDAMRHAAREG